MIKNNIWSKVEELEKPTINHFDASLSGAKVLDSSRIMPGYTLNEGKLIDIDGKVVREWPFRYLGLIQKDGSYIAQEYYESKKWGKFSFDGNNIWTSDVPIHHDIIITPDNTIMTFTKEMHRYKGRDVDFCVIVEFDQQGKELWRWSSWEHLSELKSRHKALELDMPKVLFFDMVKKKPKTPWGGNYDYYRFNSLQIIPKNDLKFQEGSILVSARHGSLIFILDNGSNEIKWFISKKDIGIEGQHSAQLLPNGRLLIFDNGRYRGWSRVIELNPKTMKIEWEYKSDDFFTLSQGYVQRLENGNTLITESEKGHVFEIDSAGKKVWEFYHPEMQDKLNSPDHPESWGSRQWIYRAVRYDKEFIGRLSEQRQNPI
ncbi:MAG: aryl-sulfate sulfotransferase [Nanoarchaeota archaeon]|nr:aryl-sulfate sulfotransferase [Nanoarchaeota archaeon]